jgi:hypothetical protein
MAGNRVRGTRGLSPGSVAERTGTSRDPLTRRRTGARPARAGRIRDRLRPEASGASLTACCRRRSRWGS